MDGRVRVPALALYTSGLAVLAAATTAVYLGMRDVMEIGGSCASGGPYEVATPCPEGTAALMVGGIFGWFLGAGLTAVAGGRLPGSYGGLALLAWPALFLSLGWNFLEFGLDPPLGGGADGGLVVCGVVFFAMGGIPLLLGLKGLRRALWPPQADAEPSGLFSLSGQFRRATPRVRPSATGAGSASRPGRRRPPTPSGARPGGARPEGARPEGAGAVDAPPRAAVRDDEEQDDDEAADGSEPAASGRGDVVRDLERLADLHGRGAIDDAEFARAKDMLLDAEEGRR